MSYYGHDDGKGDPIPFTPLPARDRKFLRLMVWLGLRERNAKEARRPGRTLPEVVADAMAALSRVGGGR
jgi:hypothetical protein